MSDGFRVLGGTGLLFLFTLWLSVATFALDAATLSVLTNVVHINVYEQKHKIKYIDERPVV